MIKFLPVGFEGVEKFKRIFFSRKDPRHFYSRPTRHEASGRWGAAQNRLSRPSRWQRDDGEQRLGNQFYRGPEGKDRRSTQSILQPVVTRHQSAERARSVSDRHSYGRDAAARHAGSST